MQPAGSNDHYLRRKMKTADCTHPLPLYNVQCTMYNVQFVSHTFPVKYFINEGMSRSSVSGNRGLSQTPTKEK